MLLRIEEQSKAELELNKFERISLVGAGEATAPMARAIEEMFGNRIHKGMINVKYGFTEDLKFTEIKEAGHPVPDENSVQGTVKILDFLKGAGEKDLIFSLISGGGSALLCQPGSGLSVNSGGVPQ